MQLRSFVSRAVLKAFLKVGLVAALIVPALFAGRASGPKPAHAVGPERLAQKATAQQIDRNLSHLEGIANLSKHVADRLGNRANFLSSGGQQFLASNKNLSAVRSALTALSTSGPSLLDADEDLSRLSGMTQSETSVAWCKKIANLGFNDSGSFVATLFSPISPSLSFSFVGWSRSTNSGKNFTDMGVLIPDPIPADVTFRDLFGDPVLGCTGDETFYFTTLSFDTTIVGGNSGISVLQSTDGGVTWNGAVAAANKDATLHFLDKPWMAVSPGPSDSPDDDVVHVTYTDFDFSFEEEPCAFDFRTAIEYVRSTDGGKTWSAPTVIDEVCGLPFVQGSQVEVGLDDDVYVAWEFYDADFVTREIRIRKSSDGGDSFGKADVVSAVTPVGDSFVLQGNFRSFLDLQGLAVDRSSKPSAGNVYVTWHDGRNLSQFEPFPTLGVFGCHNAFDYCFGDIFFSKSEDDGSTWSEPDQVNNDDEEMNTDQFMPAIDVDKNGKIFVLYYDRRRDARNFLIDTFLATSGNQGKSWNNQRLTGQSFAPITGWEDALVIDYYMGDYIAAAAEATHSKGGAILAWGDNSLGDPNVLSKRK